MDLFDNKNIKPMLLTELDMPFNNKDYIFELKYDGIRALIYIDKNIEIINRYGKNITNKFPELNDLKNITKEKCIFDGEIIVINKNKPSFEKIQERINLKNKNKINTLSDKDPAIFIAFDILYQNKDLTNLPLIERKKILKKHKDTDLFIKSKTIEEKGINLFNFAQKEQLEGIVAKKKESIYELGKRTDNWIKIKNWQEENFYICGYSVKDYVASIILGRKENNKYFFVSKVTLGKNTNEFKEIIKSKVTKNILIDFNDLEYTFILPKLKATIMYLEKTKNGHLRHPVFKEIIKNLQ